MLVLVILGMYFDAVVVEVKTFLLLFRFALAILCGTTSGNWLENLITSKCNQDLKC